jgi:hypothetical protein
MHHGGVTTVTDIKTHSRQFLSHVGHIPTGDRVPLAAGDRQPPQPARAPPIRPNTPAAIRCHPPTFDSPTACPESRAALPTHIPQAAHTAHPRFSSQGREIQGTREDQRDRPMAGVRHRVPGSFGSSIPSIARLVASHFRPASELAFRTHARVTRGYCSNKQRSVCAWTQSVDQISAESRAQGESEHRPSVPQCAEESSARGKVGVKPNLRGGVRSCLRARVCVASRDIRDITGSAQPTRKNFACEKYYMGYNYSRNFPGNPDCSFTEVRSVTDREACSAPRGDTQGAPRRCGCAAYWLS